MQRSISAETYKNRVGDIYEVLIEQDSKKSADDWSGRTTHGKVVVFPKGDTQLQKGDYAKVEIVDATSGTLIGKFVEEVV